MNSYDLIIVGAGASGIFAAITAKENCFNCSVLVIEKTSKALGKVKISGGGRCNVTHDPKKSLLLPEIYPRGSKEMRSPFSQFSFQDTVDWFASHGVKLKTESDGRIFPVTDSSQTIIDCFLNLCKNYEIKLQYSEEIINIKQEFNTFTLTSNQNNIYRSKFLILALGGINSTKTQAILNTIQVVYKPAIPSLFSFNIPSSPFEGLEGLSFDNVEICISQTKYKNNGPMIITHWGISGPAVLKLSAFAAIELHELQYEYEVKLNFLPEYSEAEIQKYLADKKQTEAKQLITNTKIHSLPTRLVKRIIELSSIESNQKWADLKKSEMYLLVQHLTQFKLRCSGKTTYKEEFVTAGGVDLKLVNMKTMECKTIPNLYFIGEMINVDGITGGFNFQNAWTTGFTSGVDIATKLNDNIT